MHKIGMAAVAVFAWAAQPISAMADDWKVVSLVDLTIGTKKYMNKPIEVKNLMCYYADVDDYRCTGQGAGAVFFKSVENDDARSFLEDNCDTMAKAFSSKCRVSLRFEFDADNVNQDIISGYQQRTIINPDKVTVVLPAASNRRRR